MKKKLNNHGYLLSELIVSSAIAIVIIFFLSKITIDIRKSDGQLLSKINFTSDQIVVTKEIMNDVNNYTVKNVTSSENYLDITYEINNEELTKRLFVDRTNNLIKYGIIKDNCSNDSCYQTEIFIHKLQEDLEIKNLTVQITKHKTKYKYSTIANISLNLTNNTLKKDSSIKLVIMY